MNLQYKVINLAIKKFKKNLKCKNLYFENDSKSDSPLQLSLKKFWITTVTLGSSLTNTQVAEYKRDRHSAGLFALILFLMTVNPIQHFLAINAITKVGTATHAIQTKRCYGDDQIGVCSA